MSPEVRAHEWSLTSPALAEQLIEAVSHIRVGDLDTLRRHFLGLGPEEIADHPVTGAVRGTEAVGAGVGSAAALPTPPAMPVELATGILGTASVEFKLIAELHEVYGLPALGAARQRAALYLAEWTRRRGLNTTKPTSAVSLMLSVRVRKELRRRLLTLAVRKIPMLMPFMVGAAIGAGLNHYDTTRLARRIRADLRARQAPWRALPRQESAPTGADS
ncbi:hypothetical protein GCM10011579_083980 [Streptomyces albiflavescens]|uniref:EcsC family protein n=1 Tax=Streptomyces albiflavescens TaxID=1623582 RepID=A0A918D9S0_9ACTN|nr:hypothetical protein [Streptomyces albiflavescens]GGN89284.1 hypothetical protein GCM10011579_083980 [Streptomyces albiflavescens]